MYQEVAQGVASDPFVRWCVGIAAVLTAATPIFNHLKGKRRDAGQSTDLRQMQKSIEQSIERSHDKLEEKIDVVHERVSKLRETLTQRLDEVEACADDAKVDAMRARHAAIGVDGKNGTRGAQEKLEKRFEEFEREVRSDIKTIARLPAPGTPMRTAT